MVAFPIATITLFNHDHSALQKFSNLKIFTIRRSTNFGYRPYEFRLLPDTESEGKSISWFLAPTEQYYDSSNALLMTNLNVGYFMCYPFYKGEEDRRWILL